jgi:hypothetical protein
VLGRVFTKKDGLVYLTKRNFCLIYSNYLDYLFFLKNRKVTSSVLRHSSYFCLRLFSLWKRLGNENFVSYLKVCLYALNSYIGGKPLDNTKDQGVCIKLSNGLPFVIPPHFRRLIRLGNVHYIHITSSLFYSYKGLGMDYKEPDLSSIMATPYEGIEQTPAYIEFSALISRQIANRASNLKPISSYSCNELPGLSAGSAIVPSLGGKRCDWFNLKNTYPEIYSAIDTFTKEIEHIKFRADFFSLPWMMLNKLILDNKEEQPENTNKQIGRLCVKHEAAGKVRVFAIGDYWSQWALMPLHQYIFDLLRKFPGDATFDQDGKLEEFMKMNLHSTFWSFDLKSATDLIPKELYIPVISGLIGETGALAWAKILDRPYAIPKGVTEVEGAIDGQWVRYTRGQPMGLLSSWAALALLHHSLVLYAYHRATGRVHIPKNYYLVLGDDIAFANEELANEYLNVCKDFGIKISIPKSFSATTIINFASRIINNKGVDLSPISLKEVIQAKTLDRKAELAYRLQRRGFLDMGLNNLFRAFFVSRTWKHESRLLISGKFSSFGMKAYRVLLQPNGHNSLTLINYILGCTPSMQLSSIPGMNLIISDKALSGYFDLRTLSPSLHIPYLFVQKLDKYLTIKYEEWHEELNKYLMPSMFHTPERMETYRTITRTFPDHAKPLKNLQIMKLFLQGQEQAPFDIKTCLNRSFERPFSVIKPLEAFHKMLIEMQINTRKRMINLGYDQDGNFSVERYITERFSEVMKLPRIFSHYDEADVWRAKKADNIKSQLLVFGKFSLYERILARELLKGFLAPVAGLNTGPFPFPKPNRKFSKRKPRLKLKSKGKARIIKPSPFKV